MVIHIPLSKGLSTTVDDEDAERVQSFKWYAMTQSNGPSYAVRHAKNIVGVSGCGRVYMHRLILELSGEDNRVVDHINLNGLDNRRSNLRIASQQQNNTNRKYRLKSASGFRGVVWNQSCQKWQAQIKHGTRSIYLGVFVDPIEAAHIYDLEARKLFGEFARLNFPQIGEQAA